MTPFKAGDVVSVEFPFSDFQTYKRRPGLVLVAGEMDLLVARLTTHPPREPSDVAMKHWSEIGLPRASTIRLTKLVTIDHRLATTKSDACILTMAGLSCNLGNKWQTRSQRNY